MSTPASTLRIGAPQTPEELAAYYALRWRILRAPWGQPRGSERDEREDGADHLCAWDAEGCLIGVGRLHLNDPSEAQIRYMATIERCRGTGVGRAIVTRLESLARGHGVERIVLNARNSAANFYRRLDYVDCGPAPILFGSIAHVRMEKRLRGGEDPGQGDS